ncbi:MAG: MoaD/ThiS family protein [Candidatus Methanomethylicia archaeon]
MKIKYIGYIASIVGTSETNIKLEKNVRVYELLPVKDRERIIALVNGKSADWNDYVNDEDTVVFMPIISGGSTSTFQTYLIKIPLIKF